MKKLLWPVVLILMVTAGCLYAPPAAKIQPTAYIDLISPRNATCGQTVSFKGHGIDPDGTIGAYNWRSSIDGDLSTADSFSTSTLSPGTHSIWFKVQDNDGQWSNEVMGNVVVATVGATKPVINSFTASPASITPGGSATLRWEVAGCTNVTIDQAVGPVSLSGTRVVIPTKTTTYTLTAINDVGSTVATVQVIVAEKPATKVELNSIASEDGQVRRDGYVSEVPIVGDTQSGTAVQAFLSFDASMIPSGATVKSVSLNLFISDYYGQPFSVLGRLYIYQCKYTNLKASDFAGGMVMPGALYSTNLLPTQSISTDMMASALQTNIDEGDNRFQIRLQFEKQQIYRGSSATSYNDLADYIGLNPEQTTLTVEYQY
jgi:hypothetical protein